MQCRLKRLKFKCVQLNEFEISNDQKMAFQQNKTWMDKLRTHRPILSSQVAPSQCARTRRIASRQLTL